MNYTGKQLKRVVRKLGLVIVKGKKHTRIYDTEGKYITTLPRGEVKGGTLAAICKQLGITQAELKKMI